MLPLSTTSSSSSPRKKNNKSRGGGGGRRNLLSALIGFSVVFALGLFSSLFLYDIDDLEESHDGGKLSLMSSSKSSGKEEEKDGERRKKKDAEDAPVVVATTAASGVGSLSSSFGGGGTSGTTRSFAADSFSSKSARTRGRGGAFPYRFKVFVYEDVPEALNADLRSKRNDRCKDNGYANAEWKIPELIAKSEVYTPDPELADFYVVPLLPECYVRDKLERGGVDYVTAVRKVNKMYQAAIDRIAGNYPYWRRSEGRDHVFIFPTEKGAENVLNEKTLERIGKAIKIVGVPTLKSLSPSGGSETVSDGDSSSSGNSNSEEKEEEERNSAKATATRRARYAFSPFRDIIIPPVRDSRDEAYSLVKAEMENVFSARRKVQLHFRGKVVGEDDEFFGVSVSRSGSGSSNSDSDGNDENADSSSARRKSASSSSLNVRRRAYEQLKGLKGVNVVIDESNAGSSFEVTGIEKDGGRKNATSSFSSSSSCDRKCVLREMRNSETCLITPHGGLEGWSTALSDAILSGCVPLIVHDDFEPYFADVLDWENFSYKIPTREALRNAEDALLHEKSKASSITRSKRDNGLKIAARASVWNDKWQSGDALDALFESLRRRVRYHRNSPFRFYAEADRNG